MKKIYLSALAAILALGLNAQKKVTLSIAHKLGSVPFAFNQAAKNDLLQDFKFNRVEYYISSIKLIHDGGQITAVPNHYILANGSTAVADLLGTFNVTQIEGIKFSIGVESPTNTGDPALWLAPHPLALKTPSMHWGWASGYRFLALEGKSGSTFNTTFEMHGLGNNNYFEQTIMVAGETTSDGISINLDADYTEALKGINMIAGPIDHGADLTDLDALKNFRDRVFKPRPAAALAISKFDLAENIVVTPTPSFGKITLNFSKNMAQHLKIDLLDFAGKTVQQFQNNGTTTVDINIETKGIYFCKISDDAENVVVKKIVVQ